MLTSFHRFRHFFPTKWNQNNVPVEASVAVAGNKCSSKTFKTLENFPWKDVLCQIFQVEYLNAD